MEATEEELREMLKGAIEPPRLEDAGLEDCALPPDAIMEAFSLAAASLRPRLASVSDEDDTDQYYGSTGGCIDDPGPSKRETPDALFSTSTGGRGISAEPFCGGAGKVGGGSGSKDEMVVIGGCGGKEASDGALVWGGDEKGLGSACGLYVVVGEGKEAKRGLRGEYGGDDENPKSIEDVV